MINIGAYAQGSNPEIDAAIRMKDPINEYLCQDVADRSTLAESLTGLLNLAARAKG